MQKNQDLELGAWSLEFETSEGERSWFWVEVATTCVLFCFFLLFWLCGVLGVFLFFKLFFSIYLVEVLYSKIKKIEGRACGLFLVLFIP